MQKGGSFGLKIEEIEKMIGIALAKAKVLEDSIK